ncbi:SCO6745 family protein [Mycobacterium paragordonae]|uniref:EvbL n=1 Tax=Mycobacterium paragordonae TaxID=1389713 RepID=A0A4R5WYT0_9MYCO|nr:MULTISPECIES: evbL [Mycobacterium]MDP7737858.1 evbL [Mycobacterium paragordonae]OBJ80188.1 evbL [Mycobacterium gordonae]TDL02225.1 evbL [Mycobacterium paragordonae]TDL12977.1 evbL [Mycobacterium paragordonae]
MTDNGIAEAVRAAGDPIQQAVAVFMLHPETFAESIAAGYQNPLAGYVAGRGGVLGDVSGDTVSSAFVVFEPKSLGALWEEGVAVRGAAGAAELYWQQTADFGRRYLAGATGLDRLSELGEKVIAATPGAGLPLYAGWRTMPLADDAPARALQVMFVLRELRAAVHFEVLNNSGITPVEAHMLNKGREYTKMFAWPEPFDDGSDKKDRYAEVEDATNRRMAGIFTAALDQAEAAELARLSADALASMKGSLAG